MTFRRIVVVLSALGVLLSCVMWMGTRNLVWGLVAGFFVVQTISVFYSDELK
jgi:hypothetical protein